jgi:signal transduction histidine kinase
MHRLVPFRTLRGRLILLTCFATLPAFLFVVYAAEKDRAAALHRAETESRYVADLASREHAQRVQGIHHLLDELSTLTSHQGDAQSELPKILPILLSSFPQLANLGLLSLEGGLVYSVVPPPRHINMATISVFQDALNSGSVAVGTYLVGLIVEKPILIMAKALREASGAPFQVLFAALDLSWFDQLTQQAGLPPETALLITDRVGNILASSLPDWQTSPQGRQLQGFEDLLAQPDKLNRCVTPDAVSRLTVAVPLKGVEDVWVVVGTPEAEVYSLADGIFYRDLVVLVMLTLFAIGSLLVVTDVSVLRDLRLLAAATRRFGKGDLKARAPVPRPSGEIRDLTLAFNAMAATLEDRHQQVIQAKNRLRALSHRLQNAREEEAARIAQELHDELGQLLSVLRLELETLRRQALSQCECVREGQLIDIIDDLGTQIDAAVQSVRRISAELRPGVLDRLGLAAGLEWLLDEFERRAGIVTDFHTNLADEPIDAELSTALFRITQEALTNVARHSGASLVQAQLLKEGRSLNLEVRDNGHGFDADTEQAGPSLGFLGMHERAHRLGGILEIEGKPGTGVRLRVSIPLNQNKHPHDPKENVTTHQKNT